MQPVKAFIVALIGIIAWNLSTPTTRPPAEVHGHAKPGCERLEELFRNVSTTERGGVTMALLKKGQLDVDLWSGYADPTSAQKWKKDTLAVAFSTTKVFVGLIFALLKREGAYSLCDQVSTVWPEYGSHGKENTTIEDVLDHKSGLLRFSRDFTLEESRNATLIGEIIEKSSPQWVPGSKMGYSGIAYGYLVDQLIRRLDKKERGAAQFFEEEIRARSADPDFYIGLPMEENHRVARVTNPSLLASSIAHLSRPLAYLNIMRTFFANDMLAESSANFPSFLDLMNPTVVPSNSPDVRALPLISSNGIGTARGMAATLRAAGQLLTAEERADIVVPRGEEEDFVLAKRRWVGRGFSYIQHPNQPDRFLVSVWGNGLQSVTWDPIEDVILVVLRNGLKPGDEGREEMEEMIQLAFP